MRWHVAVADQARADIRIVLQATLERFGTAQHEVYRAKIDAALASLEAGPEVAGSMPAHPRPPGLRRLPLRRPASHPLVYRAEGDRILVLRLLHESMDLPRRLPPG